MYHFKYSRLESKENSDYSSISARYHYYLPSIQYSSIITTIAYYLSLFISTREQERVEIFVNVRVSTFLQNAFIPESEAHKIPIHTTICIIDDESSQLVRGTFSILLALMRIMAPISCEFAHSIRLQLHRNKYAHMYRSNTTMLMFYFSHLHSFPLSFSLL